MKKLISRHERLNTPVALDPVSVAERPVFRPQQKVVDGVVVSALETKMVKPSEALSQYRVKDFALGNILAVGGDRFLQPSQYSTQPADVAASFEKIPESAFVVPVATKLADPSNTPSAE